MKATSPNVSNPVSQEINKSSASVGSEPSGKKKLTIRIFQLKNIVDWEMALESPMVIYFQVHNIKGDIK